MPDLQPHYGARRVAGTTGGIFALSYVYERRRRLRLPARSAMANLSARQAMTVATLANIAGTLAMVVFAAYYVAALCQL